MCIWELKYCKFLHLCIRELNEGAPIKSKRKPTNLRQDSKSSLHQEGPALITAKCIAVPALITPNTLHPSKLNYGNTFSRNGRGMKSVIFSHITPFYCKCAQSFLDGWYLLHVVSRFVSIVRIFLWKIASLHVSMGAR